MVTDLLSNKPDEYRLMFELSVFPTLILENGIYVEANQAAVDYLGFKNKDEIVGLKPSDVACPVQYDGVDSATKAQKYIREAKEKGKVTFEWNHCHKSGKTLWSEVSLVVFPNSESRIYTVWRDINEPKEYLNALEKSRNFYREAEKIGKLGHWELNFKSGKLHWSDEVYRIFNLKPNEFEATYEAFLNVIHPDDRDFVNNAYNNSLKTKEPYDIIHRLMLNDGEIKYVNEKCYTKFDEDGKPLHSIGTVLDITEKHNAEIENAKLSLAIEQTPMSIVITDTDGTIEYANPHACKITGYSEEELKGQNPKVLQSGETSLKKYEELWDTITSGKSWKGVLKNKKKSGEFYWESSSISPVFDKSGNIINYIAIKEDITQKLQTEESFKRSEERYKQVAELSKTVITEIDTNGLFTYVSPVAKKHGDMNLKNSQEENKHKYI